MKWEEVLKVKRQKIDSATIDDAIEEADLPEKFPMEFQYYLKFVEALKEVKPELKRYITRELKNTRPKMSLRLSRFFRIGLKNAGYRELQGGMFERIK